MVTVTQGELEKWQKNTFQLESDLLMNMRVKLHFLYFRMRRISELLWEKEHRQCNSPCDSLLQNSVLRMTFSTVSGNSQKSENYIIAQPCYSNRYLADFLKASVHTIYSILKIS